MRSMACACNARCWAATPASRLRHGWPAGRRRVILGAAEAGERFFVADEGGAVVGYASWQEDELLSLFVHPDFQGTGIGSALLSACFDDAARINATISIVKSVLVPKSSMAVMAS